MGADRIVVEKLGRIGRPVDEVRRQFGDMRHHETNRVHRAIRITCLSDDGTTCRYVSELSLVGLTQRDETIMVRNPDGSLFNEIVAGTNKGTRINQTFRSDGDGATLITFRLDAPASGLKRLLKPFFVAAIRHQLDRAFEEDRYDLEQRGYPRRPT